jgi:hypothetical protein
VIDLKRVRKEFSHAGSTSHKNDDNDAGLGFDHGFDKFDYTSSKYFLLKIF